MTLDYTAVAIAANKEITDSMSTDDALAVIDSKPNDIIPLSNGYYAVNLTNGIPYASSNEEAQQSVRRDAMYVKLLDKK
jgi:hypothetical protein